MWITAAHWGRTMLQVIFSGVQRCCYLFCRAAWWCRWHTAGCSWRGSASSACSHRSSWRGTERWWPSHRWAPPGPDPSPTSSPTAWETQQHLSVHHKVSWIIQRHFQEHISSYLLIFFQSDEQNETTSVYQYQFPLMLHSPFKDLLLYRFLL